MFHYQNTAVNVYLPGVEDPLEVGERSIFDFGDRPTVAYGLIGRR